MTTFSAENGNNWHIERAEIDPYFAAETCREIGQLASMELELPDGVISSRLLVDGRRLSGFQCCVEPALDTDRDGLLNYPEFAARVPNLLKLFHLRRKTVGSTVPGFGINILGSHGFIQTHRDAYLSPSSATVLEGESTTTITDPITGIERIFTLAVGDSFTLQNTAGSPPPLHGARNLKSKRRITFVI